MSKLILQRTGLVALLVAVAWCGDLQAQTSKQGSAEKGSDTKSEALKVGDKAPDFEVATFDDKTVKLSERFGDEGRPVILLFSRANW